MFPEDSGVGTAWDGSWGRPAGKGKIGAPETLGVSWGWEGAAVRRNIEGRGSHRPGPEECSRQLRGTPKLLACPLGSEGQRGTKWGDPASGLSASGTGTTPELTWGPLAFRTGFSRGCLGEWCLS